MFYGRYDHSLDDKNRLRIPARLKKGLGDDGACIGVSKNNKCLVIYPRYTIESIGNKLRDQLVPKEKQNAIRRFLASIYDIEEDAQGRFTLNNFLRESSGITKDLVFVGMNDRIELWDSKTFDSMIDDEEDIDLSEFGI